MNKQVHRADYIPLFIHTSMVRSLNQYGSFLVVLLSSWQDRDIEQCFSLCWNRRKYREVERSMEKYKEIHRSTKNYQKSRSTLIPPWIIRNYENHRIESKENSGKTFVSLVVFAYAFELTYISRNRTWQTWAIEIALFLILIFACRNWVSSIQLIQLLLIDILLSFS